MTNKDDVFYNMDMNNDLKAANQIATLVEKKGGRVYFVGGCVRDKLMGKESKDIDIEVHGVTPEILEGILEGVGERIEIGKSFGIYALRSHTLDIALPRTERAVGKGHRDFAITPAPFISTREAAKRRDFTIGALMEDVLTGEIIDHFGGKEDIKNKVLRHVSDETFPEDPLRVLRAAQFAARFGFTVAPETMELCKGIDLSTLSAERVLEEMNKALLWAPHPSIFFEVLRECHQLSFWFQEIFQLIGVPQNPNYHAEGDAYAHTMMVLDAAASLRDEAAHPLFFMISALCHDFGKAVATKEKDGVIHSYQHEKLGIPLVENFLCRLTRQRDLHHYVLNMVSLHMRPHQLARQNSSFKATNKLFDAAASPEDLILLAKADNLGRIPKSEHDYDTFLYERLSRYKEIAAAPQVTGKDLLEAGLSPDRNFKNLLDYAHKLHLSGVPKDTALQQTIAFSKEKHK